MSMQMQVSNLVLNSAGLGLGLGVLVSDLGLVRFIQVSLTCCVVPWKIDLPSDQTVIVRLKSAIVFIHHVCISVWHAESLA